jgi:hypothetical protein
MLKFGNIYDFKVEIKVVSENVILVAMNGTVAGIAP